ncbi:MAG: rRNA maturation RNase YbeY [Candidatus Omnitrophota bacterium]|nr:rRNA maturation RNase YbeY [Candidatus Omnitrophota bacterium]MBU1894384.1 rRNA maturation RNase YbeY [Candidatus Omnitrophota bacterium]
MIRINCRNQNKKRKINLSGIKKTAVAVLKNSEKKNAEVNIIFVSSQKMRAVHRTYLGKDVSTDVMAFPVESMNKKRQGSEESFCPAFQGGSNFLGDIIISSDKAFYNAKIYGTSFKEETALYVIHGLLHLLGYDDVSSEKKKVMKKKENEYLQKTRRFI